MKGLKIENENQTRVFKVVPQTYKNLILFIDSHYGPCKIKYVDEEGDYIILQNDIDYGEACEIVSTQKWDYLQIKVEKKKQTEREVQQELAVKLLQDQVSSEIEVSCDICEKGYGPQFKCLECVKCDLCSCCQVMHENHPMMKINNIESFEKDIRNAKIIISKYV